MSTQTPTLTGFLLARIGEDEAAAASVGEGRRAGMLIDPSLVRYANRVLAKCDAERRIVELHRLIPPTPCHCGREHEPRMPATCGECSATVYSDPPDHSAPCETLIFLALPYADHPDYKPEWRL